MAALVSSLGWVALATLLTSETAGGAGIAMVLNISLFDVGAAVGAALGGFLLATSGFDVVALGLPLFGLVSATLVWALRTGPVEAEAIVAG